MSEQISLLTLADAFNQWMMRAIKAEAEVERLTGLVGGYQADNQRLFSEGFALTAEVERLRAALHQIESDCDCDYPPSPGSIKHAAREALRATGQQNATPHDNSSDVSVPPGGQS